MMIQNNNEQKLLTEKTESAESIERTDKTDNSVIIDTIENKYILLENSSNKIQMKKDGEHIFLEGIFTQFQNPDDPDDVNENGRVYTFDGKYPFRPHYEKLKYLIDNGYIVCGSLDHPDSDAAEMNTAAFVIEKYEYVPEKNHIWGKIRILNTIPYGVNAQEFLKANKRIFISSRALGEIKEEKYASINQLITYDLVSVPGMKFAEMKLVNENYNIDVNRIGIYEVKNDNTYKVLNEAHDRFKNIRTEEVIEKPENVINDVENIDDVKPSVNDPVNAMSTDNPVYKIEDGNNEVNNVDNFEISPINAENSINTEKIQDVKDKIEIKNTIVTYTINSIESIFTLGAMFKNYNPIIHNNSLCIDYKGLTLTFTYNHEKHIVVDTLTLDISNEDYPNIISINDNPFDYYKEIVDNDDGYEDVQTPSNLKFGDILLFAEDEKEENYFNRIEKLQFDKVIDVDFSIDPFDNIVKALPNFKIKKYLVIDNFEKNGITWLTIRDIDDINSRTIIPLDWDKYPLPKMKYKPTEVYDDINVVTDVVVVADLDDIFTFIDDLQIMIDNNIDSFKNINEIGKISFNIDDDNKIYRYDVKKSNESEKSFDLNVYITESNKTLYNVTYKITDKSRLFEYINKLN